MKQRMTILCLMLWIGTLYMQAQPSGCDGNRYINEVFTEVQSDLAVEFGQAVTLGGNNYTLLMDIYEPVGDTLSERPVVILAHGGSFLFGDRSEFTGMCQDLAKRGFVAATIEYRLLDMLVFDSVAISEEVVMAIADMRAAVRYFREDAANGNSYRTDPNMIFVGGSSAGAITASHLAMLDSTDDIPAYVENHINNNGGFEGNSSNNTQFSSEVQGLLNYSGALLRDHWIDAEDPPFYSAHDEFDPTVPCGYGTTNAVLFPVYLYGSCEMKAAADELGISNHLYLVENSYGHVSFMGPLSYGTILAESVAFMEEIICAASATSIDNQSLANQLKIYPNPATNGSFTIEVQAETGSYDMTLFTLTGQTVFSQSGIRQPTTSYHDLPVESGTYLMMITEGESQKRSYQKLVIFTP